jgi:tRNA (guanine26-N2/guanine27-N2)-dimethyltransferase
MTLEPTALSDEASLLIEGLATVVLPPKSPKRRAGVFYNPKMSLNRDLAVLFASSHFPSWMHLRVCDPMTGSGVRAVRYVRESPNISSVVAADKDPATTEAARRTVKRNGVDSEVTVVELDANLLLAQHAEDRFDLIDLDPFGSPAPFFESALRAAKDGGVIAATATDMGPLTGARAAACFRKYAVRPVDCEFQKELAVRTLASTLMTGAGKLDLGISLVFSHATDHYARIYARVTKGKTSSNDAAKGLGYLEYCGRCLTRQSQRSMESLRGLCSSCGSKTKVGGPYWLGPLWDVRTVKAMIGRTPTLSTSRLTEAQTMLAVIADELDGRPFHYRTDALAHSYRVKPVRIQSLLTLLRDCGFHATRTHFHSNGFRTDAPVRQIVRLITRLSKKT